jgi:hypothetical protein
LDLSPTSPPASTNTLLAPHADPLYLPQLRQPIYTNQRRKEKARRADTQETKVRFFEEILEVHPVQGRNESAGSSAERADREFEVKEHE